MPVAPAPEGPRAPAQIIALTKPVSPADAEAEAKAGRIARWKELDARAKAGEALEPSDARWHAAYGRHPEVVTALNVEKWKAEGLVAGGKPA